MNIFGWKSAGRGLLRPVQSRAYSARSYAIPGSAGEWPRSYEAQVREGYLGNAIAQRALRLVAEGVASVPLNAPDPETAPTLLALVNATSGGQALLETVAAHILLHGNAYIEILRDAAGMPCELYALRPERIAVEADERVDGVEQRCGQRVCDIGGGRCRLRNILSHAVASSSTRHARSVGFAGQRQWAYTRADLFSNR